MKKRCFAAMFALLAAAALFGQDAAGFVYDTNNGEVTITGYTYRLHGNREGRNDTFPDRQPAGYRYRRRCVSVQVVNSSYHTRRCYRYRARGV
jgi:hypothetical protein